MDENNNYQIEKQIVRYLSGEASGEDIEAMLDWIEENDENKNLFVEYKKIWLLSRKESRYDFEKIKDAKRETDLRIKNVEICNKLKKAKRLVVVWKYAASLLLLISLSTVCYFYISIQHRPDVKNNMVEVPYGSKSRVVLPDGSCVWINAGSKINYTAGFGVSSREIYLEGEAYFDVKENKKIPFYVKTDLIDIKVYGTAFNVKSYMDDDIIETTLDRGAISISLKNDPSKVVNVMPNQKIVIHRHPNEKKDIRKQEHLQIAKADKSYVSELFNVEHNVNTQSITAWKDNRLVFEQETLEILAKRLERRYNVSIRFVDKNIKSFRYTAALKEMPIDQVMKAIALTSPIQYKIEGMQVTLTENKTFKYISENKNKY
jgi:ferric-dicitrate binding protein FerR (iron transport regulator)